MAATRFLPSYPSPVKERFQQARRESNPQPPVLETGALPIELLTYNTQGGQGGNRTPDTTIFSRVLYQLSYLALTTSPQSAQTKNRPDRSLGAGGRFRVLRRASGGVPPQPAARTTRPPASAHELATRPPRGRGAAKQRETVAASNLLNE